MSEASGTDAMRAAHALPHDHLYTPGFPSGDVAWCRMCGALRVGNASWDSPTHAMLPLAAKTARAVERRITGYVVMASKEDGDKYVSAVTWLGTGGPRVRGYVSDGRSPSVWRTAAHREARLVALSIGGRVMVRFKRAKEAAADSLSTKTNAVVCGRGACPSRVPRTVANARESTKAIGASVLASGEGVVDLRDLVADPANARLLARVLAAPARESTAEERSLLSDFVRKKSTTEQKPPTVARSAGGEYTVTWPDSLDPSAKAARTAFMTRWNVGDVGGALRDDAVWTKVAEAVRRAAPIHSPEYQHDYPNRQNQKQAETIETLNRDLASKEDKVRDLSLRVYNLRRGLIEAGRAARAKLAEDVTDTFLAYVPMEVALRVQGIEKDRDAAKSGAVSMKAMAEQAWAERDAATAEAETGKAVLRRIANLLGFNGDAAALAKRVEVAVDSERRLLVTSDAIRAALQLPLGVPVLVGVKRLAATLRAIATAASLPETMPLQEVATSLPRAIARAEREWIGHGLKSDAFIDRFATREDGEPTQPSSWAIAPKET